MKSNNNKAIQVKYTGVTRQGAIYSSWMLSDSLAYNVWNNKMNHIIYSMEVAKINLLFKIYYQNLYKRLP